MADTSAPPRRTPTLPRTIRISDDQWSAITVYAAEHETTVTQIVRDHFAHLLRNSPGGSP